MIAQKRQLMKKTEKQKKPLETKAESATISNFMQSNWHNDETKLNICSNIKDKIINQVFPVVVISQNTRGRPFWLPSLMRQLVT